MGKSVLSSTTNWGVVLAALPMLFQLVGINVEQELVSDSGNFLSAVWTLVFSGVALYGRWKAKLPLKFTLPTALGGKGGSTLVALLAVMLVLPGLTGCNTLSGVVGQDNVTIMKKSAGVAIAIYVKGYQPALKEYSGKPACELAAPPCLDRVLYAKLYAADGVVVTCLIVVKPMLKTPFPDFTRVDDCLMKIQIAKTVFADGGIKPGPIDLKDSDL